MLQSYERVPRRGTWQQSTWGRSSRRAYKECQNAGAREGREIAAPASQRKVAALARAASLLQKGQRNFAALLWREPADQRVLQAA